MSLSESLHVTVPQHELQVVQVKFVGTGQVFNGLLVHIAAEVFVHQRAAGRGGGGGGECGLVWSCFFFLATFLF